MLASNVCNKNFLKMKQLLCNKKTNSVLFLLSKLQMEGEAKPVYLMVPIETKDGACCSLMVCDLKTCIS